jgi:hypothetical protein
VAASIECVGHRFGNFLERECCGYLETFKFLKRRSRVIALADYKAEKAFVAAAPHRVLGGAPESEPADHPAQASQSAKRKRRPRGCPF